MRTTESAAGQQGRTTSWTGWVSTRRCLSVSLLLPPTHPSQAGRATHSFVIGLLLLELLHHDAPLLVLAPLVLKPDPDHAGTEARHLHQLLLHERIGPGVGSVAGPQGVQLLLIEHSPHPGGLLRLLVDVGPQGRLSGGDGLRCGTRGAVSVGRAVGWSRRSSARLAPRQWLGSRFPVNIHNTRWGWVARAG